MAAQRGLPICRGTRFCLIPGNTLLAARLSHCSVMLTELLEGVVSDRTHGSHGQGSTEHLHRHKAGPSV